MTVNRTTLLDLPLPVTGTESGTWGDTTNNGLTQYLDIAIAGTLVLSTDADVTLTSTEGDSSATNIGATTAQYAILRWTATGSTTRNITALAQSKTYVVINATGGTQSIVLRGAGPTTGVTIISGEKAFCVWNGSDFVKVSSSAAAGGSNTQVQYNSSGVLAGVSGATTNGTAITFSTTNLKLQGSSTGVSSFASANSSATDYTVTFPAASTTIPIATQTLTFSGPTAARTITLPDANFTAARTDAAQTFTGTQTFSSDPVLSGGTANGVLYLNASKVATSGSALTFDGSSMVLDTSTSSTALRITQRGTGDALLVEDSTNPDSTPFVIDASGRIIQGYTTAILTADDYNGSTRTGWGYQGNGTGPAGALFTSWNVSSAVGAGISLSRSKSATIGTQGVVASGDSLGGIGFNGDDGTNFIVAASITSAVDGTPGTNDMPGRLLLSTTPDGSDTPVERVRITSAGKTGFATSAPAATVHVAGDTILSNVNVLGASYDSVSFSVAGQETTPTDLFFSPDGLKMYVIGSVGDDVNEYNLSTAWVVSSAVFVTNFSVASQENAPSGLFFRADGTKMYIVGQTNDTVFQYTLSTPWSIATASYDSISFSVAAEATPNGLFFKPNGLSMYMVGSTGDAVYQYTLSTAWNVSTATFLQSFSVFGQESQPNAVTFTADGSRMFVMGQTGDDVNVYNLTTPWDISTLAFVNVFSVAGQDTTPQGIYIKPDGTKMYILGSTNDTVFQYTVPSIDIQLTGPTSAAALTVQQDLTVYGTTAISGTVTLNGGTANGVAYLNGSKVATSGSALTFDGTNFINTAGYLGTTQSGATSSYYIAKNSAASSGVVFGAHSSGAGYIDVINNNPLFFAVNDTEQMRLTSTGLGIGTSSPATKLDVSGQITTRGSVGAFVAQPRDGSGAEWSIYNPTGDDLRFFGNSDDRMVLTNSGNLGLGVTPSAWSSFTALQFGETGCVASNAFSSSNTQTLFGNNLYYDGAYRYIATGSAAAQYIQIGDEHRWLTAPSGTAGNAITFTQALTLDASGNLLVGATTNVANERLNATKSVADYVVRFINSNATPYGLVLNHSAASPNGTGNEFLRCVDSTSTDRMTVRSNGGIANYSANNVNLSDRREKTNFSPAKSYLDTICAIPVQTFNYIDQSENDPGLTLGVVAQDVQAVAPELVMESNWGTKEEPKMRLSIYQTDLQYALMKCIQEQQALITSLTARVAALEGTQP